MRATQSAWKSPVSGTGSGAQSGSGASSGPDAHSATPPVVDVDAADVYWYCEEWDDLPSFEAEVRTPQFSELLALIETSAAPPMIEIRVMEEARGLDYVASLRDRR